MNPPELRNVRLDIRTKERNFRERVGRYYRAKVLIHKVHFKLTIFLDVDIIKGGYYLVSFGSQVS